MKRLLLLLLFVSGAASAALAPGSLPDPAQETRARALQKELRCVVCQGESIDDSNAPIASDIRHLIRTRIVAGESNDQIKSYLVSRYGDFVLMAPPLKPTTWVLWFGPVAVLLGGAVVGSIVVIKARKRARSMT
ncbi:MAG TPA: cytochrome c-type biogenesis protein [Rhizomicrobium sp.]|nr:cytochrome c-type biogenesis protein [Rhizomicrobium sp.]